MLSITLNDINDFSALGFLQAPDFEKPADNKFQEIARSINSDYYDFQPARLFKSEISNSLRKLLSSHEQLKPSEIENLIDQISFDEHDFNYLVQTIVSTKDRIALDLSMGILAKFPPEYFDTIVKLIKERTFNYYGTLYLIEVIEFWDAVNKDKRISALSEIANDQHYSLIKTSILNSMSEIA